MDDEQPSVLSRRKVMSGLAFMGATAGAIVTALPGVAAASDPPPDTEPPPAEPPAPAPNDPAPPASQFILTSTDVRLASDGTTSAELIDADGAAAGSFWSASLGGKSGRLIAHTFQLGTGTIHGMGFGALEDATFAVIGGTGDHAGATGSYVARQRPRSAGGDGTADFIFDIKE